jgi:hypothetical protein
MCAPKHGRESSLTALDPISRATAARFAIVLTLMGLWLAITKQELSSERVMAAMNGAAFMSCLFAVLLREAFWAPELNRWDEMVAYLGLGMLARVIA